MTRTLRIAWPYLAPLGFTATTLLHPVVLGGAADIVGRTGLWLALHVVQVPLIVGLGLTLWSLLSGLTDPAASTARAAVVVFTPVYAAFDAVVGIGTGVVVAAAADAPAVEAAAVIAAADRLFTSPLGLLLAGVGSVAWAVASFATAIALRRAGAGGDVTAALVLAGVLFGLTHVGPVALAGALALLYALRRRQEQRASSGAASVAATA